MSANRPFIGWSEVIILDEDEPRSIQTPRRGKSQLQNNKVAKTKPNIQANHKCPHCSKAFTRSFALRAHLDNHTSTKRHVCEVCNLRFTRAHDLRTHKALHTGAISFACEGNATGTHKGCGRKFNRKTNLTRHLRAYEAQDNRASKSQAEVIQEELSQNQLSVPVPPQATAPSPTNQDRTPVSLPRISNLISSISTENHRNRSLSPSDSIVRSPLPPSEILEWVQHLGADQGESQRQPPKRKSVNGYPHVWANSGQNKVQDHMPPPSFMPLSPTPSGPPPLPPNDRNAQTSNGIIDALDDQRKLAVLLINALKREDISVQSVVKREIRNQRILPGEAAKIMTAYAALDQWSRNRPFPSSGISDRRPENPWT